MLNQPCVLLTTLTSTDRDCERTDDQREEFAMATESTTVTDDRVRQQVRDNYGRIAELNSEGCCSESDSKGPCCTPETKADGCCDSRDRPARRDPASAAIQLGYGQEDLDSIPDGANMGLGCGNPGAIAELKSGEVVVDLGSGGGFDCFLAIVVSQ